MRRVWALGLLGLAVLVGCGAPTPAPNSQIQPVQTLAENEASSPDGHAPESHPVREAAMELAKNGETLKAEDMMRAHAEEIAAKYGEHSRNIRQARNRRMMEGCKFRSLHAWHEARFSEDRRRRGSA